MECKHPDHVDGMSCENRAIGCNSDCVCCMGSGTPPLVDPRVCSDQDLRDIIETDPAASEAYSQELEKREKRQAEIDYYEDRFGVDR